MEKGYTEYHCNDCNADIKKDYVSELGHEYKEIVTLPTCTEKGYTTYTCTRCNDTYIDKYVDALGHDLGNYEIIKDPTKNKEGLEEAVCKRCGEKFTRFVPKLDVKDNEKSKFKTPNTSDNSNMYLYVGLLVVCIIGIGSVIIYVKKKNQ